MELKIFDVSLSFCAYLIADNGNVIVFDCGHNEQTGFRPSIYLPRAGCRAIEHLIIHNFDEDHVSDLDNLLCVLPVRVFFRNRSLPPDSLKFMKRVAGPLTPAMSAAIGLHSEYVHEVAAPPEFPGIEFRCFCNDYPIFQDTNNLSIVSFVHYDGMGIIFPGNLERAGWRELLKNPDFRAPLNRVNIFVASHHGRESGYCEEVFNYCWPEIIIISDKEIVHETQKQQNAKHASGIPWNGGSEKRYVLTTRSDGMITITKSMGKGGNFSPK